LRVTRFKRRLLVLAGPALLGAASLLSGAVLFESPERPRSAVAPSIPVASRTSSGSRGVALKAPLASKPATLASLTAALAQARRNDTQAARRERSLVIHEIARLGTGESRSLLLDLAERENGEPMERLAAISALAQVGDSRALDAIAASTSDTLVHAKIRVMRETHLVRGGKS
jgi:hypothetical protein